MLPYSLREILISEAKQLTQKWVFRKISYKDLYLSRMLSLILSLFNFQSLYIQAKEDRSEPLSNAKIVSKDYWVSN